jgi:hypothetical protein
MKFAFFISLLSVAVSLAGDLATGQRYSSRLVPWWNASIVLAFYTVVVWLLARLRASYGELELRVKQRTAALTDEMAERERIERELLEVSEREQRRIGHDLHESLGQHLTGTALAAQVLEEKLMTRGQPEAADASKVVELAEEGIVLSRKLAKGFHPLAMEADGLMQALEELAATSGEYRRAGSFARLNSISTNGRSGLKQPLPGRENTVSTDARLGGDPCPNQLSFRSYLISANRNAAFLAFVFDYAHRFSIQEYEAAG